MMDKVEITLIYNTQENTTLTYQGLLLNLINYCK